MLKTALYLNKGGYHILTFDFRNYGKSGKGNKGFTGVGLHEWPDVEGFYQKTKAPKELFWIEGDKHRFDGYNYFGESPGILLKFLKKYL